MTDYNDDPLGLFNDAKDDPKLDQLLRFLQGRGWLKAAQIEEALGRDFTDRKIRQLAEASEGQILSYPGSPGYRLTREADANERDTAINKLRSQARKMDGRALGISKIHRGSTPTSAYAYGQ